MRLRIHRKAALLGVIFGAAALLSGIVLMEYTEAFFLVLVLWIVAPVMLLQTVRMLRRRLGLG